MAGYIALFIVGVLFFTGLIYILSLLIRLIKGGSAESDPLLDKLEVKQARQLLTSGKAAGFVVYTAIFFSLIWYLFYYEPVPKYEVTSIDLHKEFKSNKAQATAKYRDEIVLVTGEYVGSELVYGSPAVLLQTSGLSEWVQCNFEGGRAEQATTLVLGEEVRLKGRVLGKTKNVVIEKCTVQ